MYSMEKYGKLKRQIDKYFIPLEINPQILVEAIKLEDKKGLSPIKAKQETLTKLSEQAKKFQLLRVTGKQLNSNFTKVSFNAPKSRPLQKSSHRGTPKRGSSNRIKEMLSQEPLQKIVDSLRKDPQSHLFNNQIKQLSIRHRKVSHSQSELKSSKQTDFLTQAEVLMQDQQRIQQIILSNPALYKKLVHAYQQQKSIKLKEQTSQKISPVKRTTLQQGIINRKATPIYRKFMSNKAQRNMSLHEVKKHNSFIQYRQFLLAINLSNRIIFYPENDISYRAFICKGNNGLLVKSIVKARPWWCLRSHSDIQNCTLVWSQWKKSKMINNLPTFQQSSGSMTGRNTFYVNFPALNRQSSIASEHKSSSLHSSIKLSKTQISSKNAECNKLKHLEKLGQNLISNKFICQDPQQPTYFTFTRRINQKKFQEIAKKYISHSVSNIMSRHKDMSLTTLKKSNSITRIMNHLPGCLQLHSKKLLFLNMKRYHEKNSSEVFNQIPQTYMITKGIQGQDEGYEQFIRKWHMNEQQKANNKNLQNIWICKPGQNSNRGYGITVVSKLQQVKNLIKHKNLNNNRTLIIQKYMQTPYLYNKRKFDIRCFLLITSINGFLKGYWYNEGYMRTSSKQYNLKSLDNRLIHLTNDAIQKKGQQYGKFQNCNKVSFNDFEKYVQSCGEDPKKFRTAKQKMRLITINLMNSCAHKLNIPQKQYCFQVFGLDFMLDGKMNPFLIQANSNPCLDVDGSVLSKIIPPMIQNVIKIAIDPIFPPPYSQIPKNSKFSTSNPFESNKFQLIYDSAADSSYTEKIQQIGEFGVENQQEDEQQQQQNQARNNIQQQ